VWTEDDWDGERETPYHINNKLKDSSQRRRQMVFNEVLMTRSLVRSSRYPMTLAPACALPYSSVGHVLRQVEHYHTQCVLIRKRPTRTAHCSLLLLLLPLPHNSNSSIAKLHNWTYNVAETADSCGDGRRPFFSFLFF